MGNPKFGFQNPNPTFPIKCTLTKSVNLNVTQFGGYKNVTFFFFFSGKKKIIIREKEKYESTYTDKISP